MIRNIIAYQIPHGWPYSAVEMTELLLRRQFVGCGPMDLAATGFVPPRDEAALCEPIAGRTVGYLLPVSKKRGLYRRVKSFDDARRAALSHARRGGRVEVGAFVPVGEAVPGAEWRRS